MDRLRVKLKKILNKDVTSLLNKYKIPLVSLALVVVLVLVEPHILQHLAHIAVQAAAVAGTVAVALILMALVTMIVAEAVVQVLLGTHKLSNMYQAAILFLMII